MMIIIITRISLEIKKGLLRVSSNGRSDSHDEGDDAEGGVHRQETGPEGGGALLAAHQQPEAEEADHKLHTTYNSAT